MKSSPSEEWNSSSGLPARPFHQKRSDSIGYLIGYLVSLSLLAILHFMIRDSEWRSESLMVGLCVVILGAWTLPRWMVVISALLATSFGGWLDIQRSENWQISTVGLIVQIAVNVLLILWTSRARRLLERARQFARVDSLTGLPNRQAIIESLDSELCRVGRFGRPFSIAMLDCDDFKLINDRHGHLAGDRLLQHIATALRASTRSYDCIGRLGGDEFVLILPETDVDEIPMVIERLRAALQLELTRMYPQLTFSIGALTIQARNVPRDSPPDRTECLKRVDDLMYAAKQSGRDQTRFETLV